MKIGYDAKRIVRNSTGLGSYGRTLINSLSAVDATDEFLLYAPDAGRDALRTMVAMRPHVSFRYPRHAWFRIQRDLWRTRGIVGDLTADGVQLYHGLSGELPVGICRAGVPAVVTIHDLIFLRHPEYYNWLDVRIYRRKFHAALREASHVIAISECTKRDILCYGDIPEERVSVVYQSVSPRFGMTGDVPPSSLLRGVGPYFLQVGTIEERKNALESVQALEFLPGDLHLVLVGRETAYTGQVRRYASRRGLDDRLHILSGVGDDELARLYRHAACFVYPSRYEGFGLPVVEAIQSGLPVVAATGSCLEEAGGPDSLYVSPDDPKALAEAVRMLLEDPNRAQRVARAQQYVGRFARNDVAARVLRIYHDVVAGR